MKKCAKIHQILRTKNSEIAIFKQWVPAHHQHIAGFFFKIWEPIAKFGKIMADCQQVYITIFLIKKTPNCDVQRRATLDEGSRSLWSNEIEQSYWSRAIN